MALLSELAKEIASKNAGNFAVTFDLVFGDLVSYQRVLDSGVLSIENISRALLVPITDIIAITPFPPGKAVKISVHRSQSSGDVGETDVFGAQQYAALLDLVVPD